MRRATLFLLVLVIVPTIVPALVPDAAPAQSQSPAGAAAKADADRLGMACALILKMTSTEWIAYFHDKSPPATDPAAGLARAIAVYGKCYDERTNRLAASLGRSGKGPLMGARGDFQDFEAALKDFSAKALAVYATNAPPAAVAQKTAYANLYEKQFRYLFYQEYETPTARAARPAPPAAKPSASSTAKPATPPASASASASGKTAGPAVPATLEEQARSDADPVTMAKNRFGKLLEPLPDETMHDLHRAFGEVVGPHHMSEATRLAVYRYAIFILEPASATPFAPPPF
jgi:hypothetical protein